MDYKKLHKDTITKLQEAVNSGKITVEVARGICADFIPESEGEKTKKEIINYLECQSRDEPSRKDTHNKWINYIEKYVLSNDDYDFLRDCARVLKTFGWQSYADRLTGLCPALGEEAKTMMSTPIIFDESEDERIRKELIWGFKHLPEESFAGISISNIITWLEKQGEQKSVNKVEPKFKVKYADGEYNVLEVKDIAGVTYYGIEDEPNHIDYVKVDNCEIISDGYGIKENGSPYPTKPAVFLEQNPAWSEEDEKIIIQIGDAVGDYFPTPVADKIKNWVKSLRPQNTWKPSDEQIEALDDAIAICSERDYKTECRLDNLRQDLKKLRKE